MDAWDAIRARRNVRSYTEEPIPDADIERILEAGRRSPSARNNQHWDFVIVTDPAALHELSTVWVGAGHIAGARAAIALVIPDPPDERSKLMDQYDLGQATMAMSIAATGWVSAPGTPRSATRTRRGPSSRYPTIVRWPICSGWVIRPIGRWPRSASRTAGRSTRWSTAAAGESAPVRRGQRLPGWRRRRSTAVGPAGPRPPRRPAAAAG